MPHIDLTQAKRLAEGVRCPTCGGGGHGEACSTPHTTPPCCTICDGDGRLFWDGKHALAYYGTMTYAVPRGIYRQDTIPAPHPVDVLMWLESVGVLEVCRTGGRWWATGPRMDTAFSDRRFADPSALLTAVLEAV